MLARSLAMAASLVALGLAVSIPANSGPVVATTGWYELTEYNISSTPKAGGTCPHTAGQTFIGQYYYPGPSKPGATTHYQFFEPAFSQPIWPFQTISYDSVTAPAGATSFSGSFKYDVDTLLDHAITGSLTNPVDHGSGTFQGIITPIDAFSFIHGVTVTYAADALHPLFAGCVEKRFQNFTFTGLK